MTVELKVQYRQLWSNLRNLLYPMTIAEVRREQELSFERGDTVRAELIDLFLCELEAEFDGCETEEY